MQDKSKIFNKALQLQIKGKFSDAIRLYLKLIKENINNDKLFFFAGSAFLQNNQYDEAVNCLRKSINLNPNFHDAHNNLGIALTKIEKYADSINYYNKALSLKKDFFDAYLNKGISLKNLKQYDEAIDCFKTCIKLNPENAKIYNNLGNLYKETKSYDKAVSSYNKALQLNKNIGEAYFNRGLILNSYNHLELAIEDYKKALKINDNIDYIHGDLLHAKMHVCDWDNFSKLKKQIENGIKDKRKIIRPFALLSLNDNQGQHKIATELYIKDFNTNTLNEIKLNHKKNEKIRIGYFSPDFREHAVSHLILDVLKNHDRTKFEIYGFNHGPRKDKLTYKVKNYFHKFYNVFEKSDEEIAYLSRDNKIDIAIDLCGYTKYSIPETFIKRAAPIQINYLGYPGTTGNKNFDYIIADKHVIPQSEFKNFSERVLHLPNCYQANQSKIKVSNKDLSRKFFKLPNDCFVFGCLNSNYKINPIIFESWMKILNQCKNSVLWLLKENNQGAINILKEASKRGVNKERIVFAKKTTMDIHLKRMRFIDLFLDTYPYGAHTTASEAIRMGIPIITMMGNSFASRVAASILWNVGLEKLITKNIEEYTKSAIDFYLDRKKILNIKNHLSNSTNTKNLFDSKQFTLDLEKIFLDLIKNKN